ncbi:DUF3533 domain-containing protein [Rummeliibacillus stabekisii]|uniref:DUF3533 domain-containing protein n=1 Tax=Rummeliibacillus stabekisii TaxID=241244 RepID=UPI001169065F|nr:DUF3533 domain-containing protein [Rummeliibacillus stabekisii]MBB5170733.1 YhgE/Pip-like protein [Rummeliibacillus stabekisii]GEL06227.1 phage infection protein [Rummeliibacillus stabekisii]
MLKNKLLLLSPIISLAVVFIFSLTLFPTVQPQPQNLPIAIVNEDQGLEFPNKPKINMGKTIIDKVQQSKSKKEDTPIKWVVVKNKKAVQKGLDHQKYYAALVIPQDFSTKQASLQTPKPTSPELQIYINQGMNMAASTAAGQILNGVVDNINNNVRSQLLKGYESNNKTLTAEQVSNILTPISKKVINVNEVKENSANGNAPVSLFQPLWIASIATAAIIFLSTSKMRFVKRKEYLISRVSQILIGAIAACIIGFGLTWLVDGMVGIHIPNFIDTALFLTITAFSFFLMISAVLSLVGFKGIAVFALLLFFGAPLLAMAPEMMPAFYQDWIYPWLPMRFMVEGVRKLLFFGEGLTWNFDLSILVWIGVVSMLIILGTSLKHRKVQEEIIEVKAEA